LDLPDRTPLLANPLEDLPDHSRLIGHDLIACLAISFVLADVTVPIRRARQHINGTATSGMLLAAATAFHDLGPLVLGDHALNLEQKVLLGVFTDGIVEEDDLDTTSCEFFDDQNLICIFA